MLNDPVQRAIEPILFRHPLVTVQQRRHCCLRKPFFVDGKLAARRNEPIDRQQFDDFLPSHRTDFLAAAARTLRGLALPITRIRPARPELPRPPHHQAGEKHLGHILGCRRRRLDSPCRSLKSRIWCRPPSSSTTSIVRCQRSSCVVFSSPKCSTRR